MDFGNKIVHTDFKSIWIVKNGISDMSIRLDMIYHTIFQEKYKYWAFQENKHCGYCNFG
jgi:hypothetical protein